MLILSLRVSKQLCNPVIKIICSENVFYTFVHIFSECVNHHIYIWYGMHNLSGCRWDIKQWKERQCSIITMATEPKIVDHYTDNLVTLWGRVRTSRCIFSGHAVGTRSASQLRSVHHEAPPCSDIWNEMPYSSINYHFLRYRVAVPCKRQYFFIMLSHKVTFALHQSRMVGKTHSIT